MNRFEGYVCMWVCCISFDSFLGPVLRYVLCMGYWAIHAYHRASWGFLCMQTKHALCCPHHGDFGAPMRQTGGRGRYKGVTV